MQPCFETMFAIIIGWLGII